MRSLFPTDRPWPAWQRLLFRSIFIFFAFVFDPFDWLAGLLQWNPSLYTDYDAARTRIVTWANARFFHIRPVLVQPLGSGDTSFAWAFLCGVACVASVGAVIWSFADRKRTHYRPLGYWFRNYLRYYLITNAFLYGLAKISLSQMGTLGLTELATPVGDLSPMRICWYFIAASPSYQVFSGITEVLVGLLLLYRRTVTFGLLLALAVFSNVMLLNFSYDICVKIFSAELVLACFVLLFRDYERIINFLVLNKTAARGELYDPVSRASSFRVVRWLLKLGFIYLAIVVPVWSMLKNHSSGNTGTSAIDIPAGVYDITAFDRNGDSSTAVKNRWQRIIFDTRGTGAIWGDSSLFKYRYGRSVFNFRRDTSQSLTLKLRSPYTDNPGDPKDTVALRYELRSAGMLRGWIKTRSDSVHFKAVKSAHRYTLQDRQFHWLSEYTR